ncbi:hypothetical protein M408DRAFT_31191 [Serendipita vermifera MAFF 305830]|uniref:Uncharacterized protein n=1 Tax=Serendipita vermifera MAFF 305830 TaxID=933852 RepID=A0A0C2WP75_SERVB|nr:hypothetical protein M408DRAFT_31191 [Serendipita vermifera MAFF 305830]
MKREHGGEPSQPSSTVTCTISLYVIMGATAPPKGIQRYDCACTGRIYLVATIPCFLLSSSKSMRPKTDY